MSGVLLWQMPTKRAKGNHLGFMHWQISAILQDRPRADGFIVQFLAEQTMVRANSLQKLLLLLTPTRFDF